MFSNNIVHLKGKTGDEQFIVRKHLENYFANFTLILTISFKSYYIKCVRFRIISINLVPFLSNTFPFSLTFLKNS